MELTSEQRALRESVRGLLRQHRPGPRASLGYDPDLWRLLSGMGVAGLAIPECFGGAGAGPVETSIVAEELGRTLAPTPLLGSAVLAAQAILAAGDTDACERLLPTIVAGTTIAVLAWTGPAGSWDPADAACQAAGTEGGAAGTEGGAAGTAGGGWTITGEAHHVLDGDSADVLIVAARQPGGDIGLFEVDPGQPGVQRQAVTAMDQTRRLAVVRLAAAAGRPLGPASPHGPAAPHGPAMPTGPTVPTGSAALARARDLACIALSAEQAGAAARALELTVDYTRTRVQFGRPIGSFQAIQHRLADLHVLAESARALCYQAAADAAPDSPNLPLRAATAKAYCSEALLQVAGEMIQMHGAIGVTWEHEAHRYFKRAHGAAQLFGQPAAHIARIATAIIDG